jgi:hypothetical protein
MACSGGHHASSRKLSWRFQPQGRATRVADPGTIAALSLRWPYRRGVVVDQPQRRTLAMSKQRIGCASAGRKGHGRQSMPALPGVEASAQSCGIHIAGEAVEAMFSDLPFGTER